MGQPRVSRTVPAPITRKQKEKDVMPFAPRAGTCVLVSTRRPALLPLNLRISSSSFPLRTWFLVVSKRPDRLLLPLQLYHSGTAAGYNPVYDLPASPHSKSTKQACGYHPLCKHGRQAAETNGNPRAGVRARVRVRDSDTPHSDHTHHGPRHTRHTQSCLHPDDRSYSAFDAGNTPLRAAQTGRHHDE